MKNKYVLLITIFLSISCFINVKGQESFYISPGISLSWDGEGSMMLGWKVSVGYVVFEKYYCNLTFGKKNTLFNEINKNNLKYSYLEIQGGGFFGYYPLSAGSGIGITFLADKIYPRISLYAGALIFIDFNYTINKNIFDLGGKLVLPIPFNEEYRKLGPG
ncbi:MAG: hypothetical protein M5U17_04305 [Ignavibacterium sp.]|nr:hypothetical protein [Ignavibacterium sp.]